MSIFNFNIKVDAIEEHSNYVSTVLRNAKKKFEEAPLSTVIIYERIDAFGNFYVLVAKNIPVALYDDIVDWMRRFKRSLL